MNVERLEGLIAAPHTPFGEDGGVRLGVIDRQAEFLVKQGVSGVFICGTTGEGYSMTVEERKSVAERWVAAAAGRMRVVVHVGCHSQGDSVELARHAAGLEVHGVACLSPGYYKPGSAADLVRFLGPVADAAGERGFYYYHIPWMNGVKVSMVELMERGSEAMGNLRGLKYTDTDLLELQRLVGLEGGRFEVLYGGDPYLLAAWMYGVRCAVGMSYNFAAGFCRAMLGAFERGEMEKAREMSRKAEHLRRVLNGYGAIAASKAVMEMMGVEVGPVRPPLGVLDGEAKRRLWEELRGTGVFGEGELGEG